MLKTSIKNSAEKMTEWLCDYRVQLPKAGLRWLRGNANPEKVSDGSILWHGYITDITEQKLHENVIAQTVKLASLGEMAAGIAHEINNPLAIIKMSSQQMTSMINREEKDHDKLLKTAEKINSSVERITKIMRGLKSYTNGRNDNQLKNESMVIIAEDTVSLCVEKFKINNVKFNVEFLSPESELMIDCRSVEISQVLLNLLNNAFDAIELIENKWITLQLKNNCGLVQISVTDCGPGIDKQEAEKIFNPFYTTKEVGKGTGLGLSIAHKIINSHGGKIWVDSECKSTRFVFELPAIVQIKKVAA